MKNEVKTAYYVVPILDTVLLPDTETKLSVDEVLGKILEHQILHFDGQAIALSVRENTVIKNMDQNSFFEIGVRLDIQKVEKSTGGYLVYAKTREKVKVKDILFSGAATLASYESLEEEIELQEPFLNEVLHFIKEKVHEIGEYYQPNAEFLRIIDKQGNLNSLIGQVLPYLQVALDKKYELLIYGNEKDRAFAFIDMLGRQKEIVSLQVEMKNKYTKKNSDQYKEALLREQLKAIQMELGENSDNDEAGSPSSYLNRMEEVHMPEEVKQVVRREVRKLELGQSNNSEANIIRNYLDTLLALPWKSEAKSVDIRKAKEILDRNHYGMDKVKERIIEHLAVMKLQKEKQGSILLLVGPPGTGKTSLGKSIAEALDREYVRMSLGGVRDEAEIRGHRRTYLGALPGRILQGMKKAGTANPVFVLDEIDKLTASHQGDPSSALLEVLDPEQNNSFVDHYLEVPYDLKDVFFIATANSLNGIQKPLLDRLEVISISSYTNMEKLHIAKDYLTKESLLEHGINQDQVSFDDQALLLIIENYTRESGVRGLRKQLDKISRKIAEKIVLEENNEEALPSVYRIDEQAVIEYLGQETARHEEIRKEAKPGVITGLAWTPYGGEILFIEGTFMPGNGNLLLTGQLGDVMKESARIAMSLIKSRFGSASIVDLAKHDLHIHVPSGATPKDGPSAGIALLTAIASLVSGKSVATHIAMTGEVTLSGKVMPVGGIKEKVLAAHRAGITEIILSKDNKRDIEEVPEEAKEKIQFHFVSEIEEVLQLALGIELPPNYLITEENKPQTNATTL